MVKKRISGQTIAIIILAVLLLLTIAFGGVFAFYSVRTSRVSGEIMLANLSIKLDMMSGESEQSQLFVEAQENVVPGQKLDNSSLIIKNLSTVSIYLVVVYEIKASKKIKVDDGQGGTIEQTEWVEDEFINPVFGLGCAYYNSRYPSENITSTDKVYNNKWYDYVFKGERENKWYRCMVSKETISPKKDDDTNSDPLANAIVVIEEDKFMLHPKMGPEYQTSTLSFTFQAYAMGASHDYGFTSKDTPMDRCQKIVSNMYEAQGYQFLKLPTAPTT